MVPSRYATFEMHEEGLHLIFETEADAIAMMPEGPSVFERRGSVLVMIRNHPITVRRRLSRSLERPDEPLC